MLGVELAHHDHALPVRDRHQDGAAALLAELAEGLRGLVLLVGRKVARPQHEAHAIAHGRQHAVDLAFLRESLTTVGELVAHLMTTHPAFHLGQLSTWRRANGLPSVLKL